MTDLSISNPHAYAVMTAACWAVPAIALVWGAFRWRRYRNRPCGARFEIHPDRPAVFTCARQRGHAPPHSAPRRDQWGHDFEWYDDEHPKEGRFRSVERKPS